MEVAFGNEFRKRDLKGTEAKEEATACAHSGRKEVAEVLG